jgi:hypothetical protein
MNSSFTITAAAALLLVMGPALAGGMPSDEGPEILLEEGEEMFTPTDASSLDSELPDYSEIELAALEVTELSLPPASDSPPAHFSVRSDNRLHPRIVSSMR